jgi:hypothetical protein
MNKITLASSPYLSNMELAALRHNKLELHCIQMRLEQCCDKGRNFTGPGMINQAPDGQLEFTIYASELVGFQRAVNAVLGVGGPSAGQLVPDADQYRLSATDMNGRDWKSDHIIPYTHTSGGGTICTGTLREISLDTEWTASGAASLHLEACGGIEFPANTVTTVTKTIGDQPRESCFLDVLKYESASHSYTFRKEEDYLVLDVIPSGGKMESALDIRVSETLQFVLSQPIQWSLVQTEVEGKLGIRIRTPRRYGVRPRLKPPIAVAIESVQEFCAILDKYMAYVLAETSGQWMHPISVQVLSVCNASMSTIEAEATALCIAVESILNLVHESDYRLSPGEREWIDSAVASLDSCGCPDTLKQRVEGVMRNLNDVSAAMRLGELADLGVITHDQIGAWKRVRNRLLHGKSFASLPLQTFLDLMYTVRVLVHHLVFHAIGYRGKYTDYASPGWPTREYPPPLTIEPVLPIADPDSEPGMQ